MRTLAIVGAGPGLGAALARRFGAAGFGVALLARTPGRVDRLAAELREHGVIARGYPADVTDPAALTAALDAARVDLGELDALAYLPSPELPQPSVDELTPRDTLAALQRQILGAVTAVGAVLPDMRRRRTGSLLFTTGPSALYPSPALGAVGLASGGLRNYVLALNEALHPDGVFAALVVLDLFITPGAGHADPDHIADRIYELHRDRHAPQIKIGTLREASVAP